MTEDQYKEFVETNIQALGFFGGTLGAPVLLGLVFRLSQVALGLRFEQPLPDVLIAVETCLVAGLTCWLVDVLLRVKKRLLARPVYTFNLPSDALVYSVLRGLYFLMPDAVAEQAVNLIEIKRPEWTREYGRLCTEILTFRYLGRWLFKEVLYIATYPFRVIWREVRRYSRRNSARGDL